MAEGARAEAIPLQRLMELILDRPVVVEVGEDNQSTITAVKKAYSLALRYTLRQQQCSVGGLHELFTEPPPPGVGTFELKYRESETHKWLLSRRCKSPQGGIPFCVGGELLCPYLVPRTQRPLTGGTGVRQLCGHLQHFRP